jgi:hypothetical protein
LTPVGILAVGSAWGEWSVGDFTDASARKAIAAASGNMAAPAHVPAGLARLSSLWNAPLARYAPDFVSNAALGYLLSAFTGVAIIALLGVLLRWRWNGSRRRNFIEKTTRSLLTAAQDSFFAEQTASATGFLQQLDPRVKIAGLGVLIAACIAVHRLQVLFLLFTLTILLAFASKIGLRVLATRRAIRLPHSRNSALARATSGLGHHDTRTPQRRLSPASRGNLRQSLGPACPHHALDSVAASAALLPCTRHPGCHSRHDLSLPLLTAARRHRHV